MSSTILIVDDDPIQRRLLETMVQRLGYHAQTCESGEAALARLDSVDGGRVDLLVLDLVMPDLDGMGVLERLSGRADAPPVIVQTANGSIETVIAAMRAGAADFVVKPVGAERLSVSIKNALRADALEEEIRRINRQVSGTLSFSDLVTRSPEMSRVIRLAERAAKSNIPVLIEGESGVGKELIARAIHGSSERSSKPFVAVNCGAIPDNLVESILFGHEKGAFTGATEKHTGKFVEASGGTLFLDEVSELPLAAQVKLLRALQEGEVEAVGGRRPVKVDVRIISATNRQLLDHVKAGHFREDLFYRLHVLPLTVPPLRARREDIPLLARHFLARFCAEENRHITGVDAAAMTRLAQADWPGNVRQLENTLYRAVVLSDGEQLTLGDFPQLTAAAPTSPPAPADMALTLAPAQPAMVAAAEIPIAPPLPAAGQLSMLSGDGEIRPLDELENEIIRFAISYYRGQMSEVARRLKIGRSTLYRKLDEAAPAGDGE